MIVLPFLLIACSSPKQEEQSAKPYNGEYGKSGPGSGESCYVKTQDKLRCAEAKLNDAASLSVLRKACQRFEGQHVTGTCTAEKHLGTCRKLRGVPGVIIRYYEKWDLLDAQIECGETFHGLLDQTY